jgi:hypothetical protein
MSKRAKAVADSQLGRCTAESRNEDQRHHYNEAGIIAEIDTNVELNVSVINFGVPSMSRSSSIG